MSNSRKILYLLLVLPILVATVFLVVADGPTRRDFVGVYGSTLKRMVAGEWSFSELTESHRRNGRPPRAFGGGYRGPGPQQIFRKLDGNKDETLTRQELGHRLAMQLLGEDAPGPVTQGQLSRLLVNARPSESLENPAAGNEKRLIADDLFDPEKIMRVDVEISNDDWQKLCWQTRDHRSATQNPLDKPYTNFKANVTVNGVRISNVGIRKKGFIGSQDTVRPSLKIKFDEYIEQSPVDGLDRLTLNNNKQDRGLVSQTLTYQLFRKAGVPAPRTSFATVSVNGKHLGVYTHVESVRKPFLQNVFGDDSGRLYEGTLTDLYPPSIEWLEPKVKAAKERDRVLRLAEILSEEQATLDDIAGLVDIDNFLRYWCVESLINFWDGYSQNQNNYFIYDRPDTHLMCFMPWGADSCFGERPHFVQRGNVRAESIRANGILANKLYQCAGIPEEYHAIMSEIMTTVWNEEALLAEIDRIEALLHDELDAHQVRTLLGMDDVRRFIRSRRETIAAELADWPQNVADQPRIPRHDVTVGTGSGRFHWEDDAYSVSGFMTIDNEEIPFERIEVESDGVQLIGAHRGFPFEVNLRFNDLNSSTSELTIPLTGSFSDNPRGISVEGSLKVKGFHEWNDETVAAAADFEFTVKETRGGFMDRRR